MLLILNKVDQKVLIVVLSGALLLLLASSSVYAIWPQIKDMRLGVSASAELKGLLEGKQNISEQHNKLLTEIERVKRNLKGDMANLPEEKMQGFIIGELQNISWNHQVNLIGVKPVKGGDISMFQEILFNVRLSGDYFDLYDWLQELRSQLGFIVIKSMEIKHLTQGSTDDLLVMRLTLASYKSV